MKKTIELSRPPRVAAPRTVPRLLLLTFAGAALFAYPLRTPGAPASQPAAQRAPVPGADAQAAALRDIRVLFKDDYARHGSPERRALAAKLYQRAGESGDDPAARFALLSESRDQAAAAGDVPAAAQAARALVAAYAFAPDAAVQMQVDLLNQSRTAAASPADAAALAEAALVALDEAFAADRYDLAAKLGEMATAAADKARDRNLGETARAKAREAQLRRVEFDAARKAEQTLAASPDNPAANTTYGRYLCLMKGDWDAGLPLLRRGADPNLKAAADLEAFDPSELASQVKLGDAWWVAAAGQPEAYKLAAQSRAGKWYAEAATQAKGLTRDKVDSRLKEVDAAMAKAHLRRVVNLLALVDPEKDAVAGKWALKPGGLASDESPGARLALPYAPPDEYDFVVEFTPAHKISRSPIVQLLANSKVSFLWAMGTDDAAACAFANVAAAGGGAPAAGPANPTAGKLAVPIEPNARYVSVVQVRRTGVRALVNGQVVSEWKTDYSDLSQDKVWQLPGGPVLGVGTWGCSTTFSRIEVIEVSRAGKRLR